MKAQLILDIISAHSTGSEDDFRKAVESLANDEDLKGNNALATEIRRAAGGMPQKHRNHEGTVSVQGLDTDAADCSDIIEMHEPKIDLDELILDPAIRKRLDQIVAEWNHPELLPSGIDPTSRVLLTGPPGCGKTMTAYALASSTGKKLAYIRLDGLVSRYMGQTGANIRRAFKSVSGTDVLLFIDEFDAVAKTRRDDDDMGESKRMIASLLQNLDTLDNGVLMVAATNMPEIIDPAVVRRFDIRLDLDRPGPSQRRELISPLLDRYALSDRLYIQALVDSTEGMSFAETESSVKSIVRYMAMNDQERFLDGPFIRKFVSGEEKEPDIAAMRDSGMTLRQIETITGIPRSTISYRLRRERHEERERRLLLDTGRLRHQQAAVRSPSVRED